MNVQAYLKRIGYTGPLTPNAATLAALHHAHLLTVPFENLDIHLGRPIPLDLRAHFDKVVRRRRGGFCYELNGLFGWLLTQLGYEVTLLSAGVYNGDGEPGPEYDHLTLLVRAPGDPTPWLADVGFGEGFREPLRLDVADPQPRHGRMYQVGPHPNPLPEGEGGEAPLLSPADAARPLSPGEPARPLSPWERPGEGLDTTAQASRPHPNPLPEGEGGETGGRCYCEGDGDGGWKRRYWFTLTPRQYAEFADMCYQQQTSPRSAFTRHRVCSLATPLGRITLAEMQLIITERGERRQITVADEAEYHRLLREHFGVDLSL